MGWTKIGGRDADKQIVSFVFGCGTFCFGVPKKISKKVKKICLCGDSSLSLYYNKRKKKWQINSNLVTFSSKKKGKK